MGVPFDPATKLMPLMQSASSLFGCGTPAKRSCQIRSGYVKYNIAILLRVIPR